MVKIGEGNLYVTCIKGFDLMDMAPSTVSPHEDIGKFPNCLNSIPNENLGLKKENEQYFFCKYLWRKKTLLLGENCWSRPKFTILAIFA